MGVQGLLPFLRKACPSVFQKLPNRFEDIRRTRVVIDGTLVTQRFHFAPSYHPHRHVLRWHRIAEELQQSDVSAICIFDGKGRHTAKVKEITRRRENQKLVVVRGQIESARFRRLGFLQTFLLSTPSLPSSTLKPTFESLVTLISKDVGNPVVQKALQTLDCRASDGALSKLSSAETDSGSQSPTPGDVHCIEFQQTLLRMYKEYKKSISQLVTITKEDAKPTLVSVPDFEGNAEKEINTLMTEAQSRLTIMEKNLWSGLIRLPGDISLQDLVAQCADLVQKSEKMAQSFERRTNPPTFETYRQSQEILKAMGVQCITTEGDIEAEGLASSMVLNGQADFVASEDTDVLVYGATLLRNLTSGNSPLEILSAEDVQTSLDLDHRAFIDFALLLGTDFTQRLKNVGPVRALSFISQYGSIEHILEAQPKYPPRITRDEYLCEIKAARSVFNSRPATMENKDLMPVPRDEETLSALAARYRLGRAAPVDLDRWGPNNVVDGGYFADSPSAA